MESELVSKLFEVLRAHRGAALTNSAFVERLHRPSDSRRGTEQCAEPEMTSVSEAGLGRRLLGMSRSPGTRAHSRTLSPTLSKQNTSAEPSRAVTQPGVRDSVPQGKEFGET